MIKFVPLVALLLLFIRQLAWGQTATGVGQFSEARVDGSLPRCWAPLLFPKIKRPTRYNLVKRHDKVVVEAQSDASASGLNCKVCILPEKLPIIRWHWKITRTFKKGDATRKSGDDFAARLFISFRRNSSDLSFIKKAKRKAANLLYGKDLPSETLVYIWANKAARETIIPSAYTDRAKMIVIESGDSKINRWVVEERNWVQDYVAAFGKPPPPISAVAIMTDSDSTGEWAVTYYGDINFYAQ